MSDRPSKELRRRPSRFYYRARSRFFASPTLENEKMKRLFCLSVVLVLPLSFTGCEEQKDTREIKIETPRSSTTIKTEVERKDKDPE